mmetsp:Transcript_47562/g.154040  ORF Transcript_47562/g.154040 Transcript_47562/m.154040 type:complete len:240 (+) Transcript_47562:70-789(+)
MGHARSLLQQQHSPGSGAARGSLSSLSAILHSLLLRHNGSPVAARSDASRQCEWLQTEPYPIAAATHRSAAAAAAAAQHESRMPSAEGRASGCGLIMLRSRRPISAPQSAGGGTDPDRSSSQRGPEPGRLSAVRTSYSTMPKEKMSAAVEGFDSSRSRERYFASPSCSFHALSAAAWPRSPILKTPSDDSRMLSGLMSQWYTECACKWATAAHSACTKEAASTAVGGHALHHSRNVPLR